MSRLKTSIFLVLQLILITGLRAVPQIPSKGDNQKHDTIHIVGHAHMDMNWLWTYSETVKMCNDNLRQATAFIEEFPDFTMLQSQAAVYQFVEKNDPPLFLKIKDAVKSGHLEPAGGMWTEGDANLSSGEALSRSFLLGQRYFKHHFGKTTNIGWLPDNFGHPSQLPQMLKLAGMDYFYFHRCKPYIGTFWWQGSDSTRILCYANDTYNGEIKETLKDEVEKLSPQKRRILHITGVGDHGGGPTRANIDMIHQLDKSPGNPTVKFTTARDFFRKSMAEMDSRPVHHGEMQFVFEGCYSNVSDIKEGNRNCENSLFTSEFFNTLRWINGETYPAGELRNLWETVTFNQFHDILPGSAIHEANKEAIARYTETLRLSKELTDNAFRRMADEIKFDLGKGQPIVAFNLQPNKRKAIVEAEVFSYQEPVSAKLTRWSNFYGNRYITPVDAGQGLFPTVMVRDGDGNTYPAQVIEGESTPPGFTSKIQFVANNMPAGGYKTFYVDVTTPGEFNQPISFAANTFETDYFRITFDIKTGGITSLVDKRTGKQYVREHDHVNKLRMYLEDKKGGMKSWTINKIVKTEDVTDVKSVKIIENGPVRACVETVKTWGKSRFIERTYIYRSYPRIDYDMEVHWLETGSDSTDSPMLRAVFPIAMENPRMFCQVPFDVVERPANGKINGGPVPGYLKSQSEIYGVVPEKNDGQEVPAQKWVDITDGTTGIALLNKTKYGHSFHNGELRLTLMRAAGDPDVYPNLGKFTIKYALFPHVGDWKNGVWDEGEDFNMPVYAAEPPSLALGKNHAVRTEEASFFNVSPGNVKISGIKQAEEGENLIIRFVETEGEETKATIQLPFEVTKAECLGLIEQPIEGEQVEVQGKTVSVKLKPHQIVTLGIK